VKGAESSVKDRQSRRPFHHMYRGLAHPIARLNFLDAPFW
jgi:hypothetical protein